MRIAHVTATFPPYFGGTGTVCYHNALGLARLGHQVTVFTAAYPSHRHHTDPAGITVRRSPALFRVGNAPLLTQLLKLQGFDIVHLHYPFYFGAESLYLQSLTGDLQYVVTYHQDVLFAGLTSLPVELHHRLLGERILSQAARVLATSWDYAQASRLKTLLHKKPGHVAEMPNGVDAERFHPGIDGESLRAQYRLEPTDQIILFVGGLDSAHYFKGVGVLLQTLTRLPKRRTKLLIVGEGDLRPTYQAQALELGLEERVIFCGRVPDADLPAHYALSDLLVLPSTTMGEAFGVVLLEAMACAKPVIASNLPGVRAVVSDGQDGLLAQPGDAHDLGTKLRALLAAPEQRWAMGQRGRAKVEEKYHWPKIIQRLVKVYEKALLADKDHAPLKEHPRIKRL